MKYYRVLFLITIVILESKATYTEDQPCQAVRFGHDSVACKCDSEYCDSANPRLPHHGEFLLVTSNKAGHRFASSYGRIDQRCDDTPNEQCTNILNNRTVFLTLDREARGQSIIGFGSTITDAVGINLNRLDPDLQEKLIYEFWGPEGLKYNMVKTTIGHSGYSPYSYCNTNRTKDIEMNNWELTYEDRNYKIPFLWKAKEATEDDLIIMANVWTAPEWMIRKNFYGDNSQVSEDYYHSYALHITKYLQAYKDEGLEHWGVSYVNEPWSNWVTIDRNTPEIFISWNTRQLAQFATEYLIPMLREDFSNVNVLYFDEHRYIVNEAFMNNFRENTDLMNYIEYIALHANSNSECHPTIVDNLHKNSPHITILDTEFSAGQGFAPKLGAWSTVESYASILMEEINHWYSAWVDGNLVVDTEGGPNYGTLPTDATVVIGDDDSTFYKQPSFYALGHFSKFIPRGSERISLTSDFPSSVECAAVRRPDGLITALLWNPTSHTLTAFLKDEEKGTIRVTVSANSINTIVF